MWGRACCISQDQHRVPRVGQGTHSIIALRVIAGCSALDAQGMSSHQQRLSYPFTALPGACTRGNSPCALVHHCMRPFSGLLLDTSCTRPTSAMLPLANLQVCQLAVTGCVVLTCECPAECASIPLHDRPAGGQAERVCFQESCKNVAQADNQSIPRAACAHSNSTPLINVLYK